MINENDVEKMRSFIGRLLSNDNIKNEPFWKRENHIINFIKANQQNLKTTLNSPQFFPDLQFEEILRLLFSVLKETFATQLTPILNDIIDNRINFKSIIRIERRARGLKGDSDNIINEDSELKSKLKAFLVQAVDFFDVRTNMASIVNFLMTDMMDKYVEAVSARKNFINNELFKVERIAVKPEEYADYIKLGLILRNCSGIKIPIIVNENTIKVNYFQTLQDHKVREKYLKMIIGNIQQKLRNVHDRIINESLRSNLPDEDTELSDAVARIVNVFALRARDFKVYKKIDRGADTPDKSWFGIIRKNHKSFGLNQRLLEDLYIIASEENW